MNGLVFHLWFQSTFNAPQSPQLGEFSDAEIAARQAVRIRPSLARRLLAGIDAVRNVGAEKLAAGA